MKKSKAKKILLIMIILLLNTLNFINAVNASNINSAYIHATNDCGQLLTYKGITVKVTYVQYTKDGVNYPAYCMDKTKPGAETSPYNVSIEDTIKDVGLWRIIVNGYPYKSIQELGVANKEEAFTATKQAVYCYIHGNNLADYAGIGESGKRTLNAMKNIITNAQNSTETKISSTIKIDKNLTQWQQDNINKDYLSKTYKVTSGTNISSYKITLTKENQEDIGGIKLTDEKNNEKTEFNFNEKFKVLIPIKNMKEAGKFNLKVEAKIKTKPILYGSAPNSNVQDYALTAASYEDGIGIIEDEYHKNETKITIIKQDEETKEKIEGVEFELLDKDKNVVYNGLKTNKEGKIYLDNLIPGTYYLKETNELDGYIKYDEAIKVDLKLNEEVTITINNKKEEKPKIETSKKEVEVTQEIIKSEDEKNSRDYKGKYKTNKKITSNRNVKYKR